MTPNVDFQPDDAYFDTMARHARSHWWYEGRRALVRQALQGITLPSGVVLDVGCGTGDNLEMLSSATGAVALGTDLSRYALQHVVRGEGRSVRTVVALAEHLPVASATCALLSSMDVVEHLDDDLEGLLEYRRVLARGGHLLLTVPAYQWLWGKHDVWAAHRRRYNRASLVSVVERAGIEVLHTTYFNSFLVPPAVALRRTPLKRLVRESDDDVASASPFVSKVMTGFSGAERRMAQRVRVPFGLSILLLGRRRD